MKKVQRYQEDYQLYQKHIHLLKRVNRKPITATEEDLDDNNRARSAKLRVAEILK